MLQLGRKKDYNISYFNIVVTMKQHALVAALKEFDKNSWLLMGLMFFVKAGFFMTIPYFSFYLYYRGYTPIQIGWVVAAGPMVASLLNLWSGFLTDKFGKKKAMVWAFVVLAVANMGISGMDGFWVYLVLNAVLRLGDATFNGAMQAYIGDSFPKETQRFVFHIRFMILNAAAAVGPIAGALFAESHSKILFDLSAGISILAAIVLYYWLDAEKKDTIEATEQFTFFSVIKVLKDTALLWIILAFFLYWMSYLQLDSTLAQILARVYPHDAVYLFAMCWVINTVVIVVFQLPMAHLTRKFSYKQTIWVASSLLMAGFFVIAHFLSTAGLAVSLLLITFGEILLSPLSSVLIAEMAPPGLKATYYGASNFAFMGAGFAPIVGGVCLAWADGQVLFMGVGCLFIIVLIALLRANRRLNVQ